MGNILHEWNVEMFVEVILWPIFMVLEIFGHNIL